MAALSIDDLVPQPDFRERHELRIAAQMRAFAQPDWVKAAFDFVLEADGDGTLVSTETRVSATDARTRRRFGLYWMLIRAGSGLIRRDLLRELARRATTDGSATARGAMPRVRAW
jgi:hypothetical protein